MATVSSADVAAYLRQWLEREQEPAMPDWKWTYTHRRTGMDPDQTVWPSGDWPSQRPAPLTELERLRVRARWRDLVRYQVNGWREKALSSGRTILYNEYGQEIYADGSPVKKS